MSLESAQPTRTMTTSLNRRQLLQTTSCGFGYLALRGLIDSAVAKESGGLHRPDHSPRAKRVIFLFMQGGPSHLDTFDYKPDLEDGDGKTASELSLGKAAGRLKGPQFAFAPRGKSGLPISDLFPHLSRHADDLCLINGMHTNSPAHPQASIMLHTGSQNFVRPSLGSWLVYGLGSENQDLPGFVTINPPSGLGGAQNYGSAFLPATFQGTPLSTGGKELIPNIRNNRLDSATQRRQLDYIQKLNRGFANRTPGNSELDAVVASYELAFRMQSSVPGVVDLASEPQSVQQRYGIGEKATNAFGTQCLMARRLAEAGVRFIQLSHGGWDQHNDLKKKLAQNCAATDQPIAALLGDLKDRGMLDETLVLWGGEFGRSPEEQGKGKDGRRHNNRGYTMWMAGGGVRGGIRYGSTDRLGGVAVADKMHIHDLHATILHLMGVNHEKLTYRYGGRDFRLTDVYGEVAHKIVG